MRDATNTKMIKRKKKNVKICDKNCVFIGTNYIQWNPSKAEPYKADISIRWTVAIGTDGS